MSDFTNGSSLFETYDINYKKIRYFIIYCGFGISRYEFDERLILSMKDANMDQLKQQIDEEYKILLITVRQVRMFGLYSDFTKDIKYRKERIWCLKRLMYEKEERETQWKKLIDEEKKR